MVPAGVFPGAHAAARAWRFATRWRSGQEPSFVAGEVHLQGNGCQRSSGDPDGEVAQCNADEDGQGNRQRDDGGHPTF